MADGWASIARSGGAPPSMRVRSTVSWLEPMLSTTTSMPVAASNGASAAAKLSPSPPIHWVWIETLVPLNGWSAPIAWSSSA